jgi:hypothetical protein
MEKQNVVKVCSLNLYNETQVKQISFMDKIKTELIELLNKQSDIYDFLGFQEWWLDDKLPDSKLNSFGQIRSDPIRYRIE